MKSIQRGARERGYCKNEATAKSMILISKFTIIPGM